MSLTERKIPLLANAGGIITNPKHLEAYWYPLVSALLESWMNDEAVSGYTNLPLGMPISKLRSDIVEEKILEAGIAPADFYTQADLGQSINKTVTRLMTPMAEGNSGESDPEDEFSDPDPQSNPNPESAPDDASTPAPDEGPELAPDEASTPAPNNDDIQVGHIDEAPSELQDGQQKLRRSDRPTKGKKPYKGTPIPETEKSTTDAGKRTALVQALKIYHEQKKYPDDEKNKYLIPDVTMKYLESYLSRLDDDANGADQHYYHQTGHHKVYNNFDFIFCEWKPAPKFKESASGSKHHFEYRSAVFLREAMKQSMEYAAMKYQLHPEEGPGDLLMLIVGSGALVSWTILDRSKDDLKFLTEAEQSPSGGGPVFRKPYLEDMASWYNRFSPDVDIASPAGLRKCGDAVKGYFRAFKDKLKAMPPPELDGRMSNEEDSKLARMVRPTVLKTFPYKRGETARQ